VYETQNQKNYGKDENTIGSMMNTLITMPEIIGKHLNKRDKIAINPLELKIGTTNKTNFKMT